LCVACRKLLAAFLLANMGIILLIFRQLCCQKDFFSFGFSSQFSTS